MWSPGAQRPIELTASTAPIPVPQQYAKQKELNNLPWYCRTDTGTPNRSMNENPYSPMQNARMGLGTTYAAPAAATYANNMYTTPPPVASNFAPMPSPTTTSYAAPQAVPGKGHWEWEGDTMPPLVQAPQAVAPRPGGSLSSPIPQPTSYTGVPMATAGIDTTRDGRPNITVTGVDMNRDGIPDVLQQSNGVGSRAPPTPVGYQQGVPMATAGVDTTRDGRANITVTGVDMNRDGIPDILQQVARPTSVSFPVPQPSSVSFPTSTPVQQVRSRPPSPRGHWEWEPVRRPVSPTSAPAPRAPKPPVRGHWEWEPVRPPTPSMAEPVFQQKPRGHWEFEPAPQPKGHWEFEPAPTLQHAPSLLVEHTVPMPVPQQQPQIVDRAVPHLIERPIPVPQVQVVERIVEVEKPVYIDRPVPMHMPHHMQQPWIPGPDLNRGFQPPSFNQMPQTFNQAPQVIDRPVYIETPVPIPFERPFPVPVPENCRMPTELMMRRMAGLPEMDFPYHNPYTELGAGFYDRRLEASNEPDPMKAFLERMRPFSM